MSQVGQRYTVTNRFYLIAIVAIVTLVTGMATGFDLFYRLFYILIITVTLAIIWLIYTIKSVDISIERKKTRISVGDLISDRLQIRGRGSLLKSLVILEDESTIPGYTNRTALVPSKGYRLSNSSTRITRRGIFTIGPVSVTSADVLGIFNGKFYTGVQEEIMIFPKVVEAAQFELQAHINSSDSSIVRPTQVLTPHASAVREYAYGDSLSRIHWKSTAKHGKLMSKDFDLGLSDQIWILVDMDSNTQFETPTGPSDELIISTAASLMKKYSSENIPVGFIANGDRNIRLECKSGEAHFEEALTEMASLKAEGNTNFDDLVGSVSKQWTSNSSVVLITTASNTEWIPRLIDLSYKKVNVTVVIANEDSTQDTQSFREQISQLSELGISPYVINSQETLSDSLSETHFKRESRQHG